MTKKISPAEVHQNGLGYFSKHFRSGLISSEDLTAYYLGRIEKYDGHYGAFEYVDAENALQAARAMDLLIHAGTDLGPLMGVPVAIKDVFNIKGMPRPNNGSNVDLSRMIGTDEEASFVGVLRQCGAVLLGKTKAVEFCLGITGVSGSRGTPRNPWDAQEFRIPGGSSSGSAVALGAGMCMFAVGSDSGGSVRIPAALNGLFGLKTSFGIWPTDGAAPLDPRVDTVGLITQTASDAKTAFLEISKRLNGIGCASSPAPAPTIDRLTVGLPDAYFKNGTEPEVADACDMFLEALKSGGAKCVDFPLPEAAERSAYFPLSMPVSVLASMGVPYFKENQSQIDAVIGKRIASGLEAKAHDFLALEAKRQNSIRAVHRRLQSVDVVVTPTATAVAPLLSAFDDPTRSMELALGMTQNTQPANYLALCAVTMPSLRRGKGLPIGVQLMAAGGNDLRLLQIACEIEAGLPAYDTPDIG